MLKSNSNLPAWCDLLFYSFIATIFLLLASTCSPLYAFNDWVDSNSFFTMGKGMVHGLVPYRDLFEQKGPLLYLIHAFSFLISNTTFLGVFIFEAASLTAALFFAAKIAKLFLPGFYVYFIIPVLAYFSVVNPNFEAGDSAEEFCYAVIMAVLYIMVKYYRDVYPKPLSDNSALLAGIAAGLVFMVKYTMLGYWIGFVFMLSLTYLCHRRFKDWFWNAIFFLTGFFLSIAPWMLYFAANSALDDFFHTYIWINIKLYSQSISLLDRIRYIGQTLSDSMKLNALFSWITLFGLGAFGFSSKYFKNIFGRLSLAVCTLCLAISTYFGGRSSNYYFLGFFPLLVFGLIAIAGLIAAIGQPDLKTGTRRALIAGLCFMLVLATISFSPNIPLIKKSADEYPQFRFAKIINQVPDATLINYGFLDGGFYTAANITPELKYFMINNISDARFPIMRDEQDRYIREKAVTFVVIRMDKNADASKYEAPCLHENYALVDEATGYYKSSTSLMFKYALYQVR